MNKLPVVVIGGGWSGLSCCVALAAKGVPVILLESARQLGGRARGVKLKHFSTDCNSIDNQDGFYSDNGHHIMLGAYHNVRQLLNLLNLRENEILLRKPLELNLFTSGKKAYTLKAPHIPAPLHLIVALMRDNGFTVSERYRALKMVIRLAMAHFSLDEDISVHELLLKYSQTPELIQGLWEPLCLAALNTPIDYASAEIFINVLRDSFSRYRSDSDVLFFKTNLSRFLAVPAREYIAQHGGQIRLASKVSQLQFINNQISAVVLDLEVIPARQVVMATPADITRKLLKSALPGVVPAYQYEPICTVYLQYPEPVRLPTLMTGLINATSHWAFEHSIIHQPSHKFSANTSRSCVIAVVISGPGQHMKLDNNSLALQVHQELDKIVGQLPAYSQYQVIREKKATFSCQVGIQKQRPACTTAVKGLYLAGDYTDTDYPATLEGAVKSGFTAAQAVTESA